MSVARYIVYRTSADDVHPAGYVVNAIMWDGIAQIVLPENTSAALDLDHQYPLGSIFDLQS